MRNRARLLACLLSFVPACTEAAESGAPEAAAPSGTDFTDAVSLSVAYTEGAVVVDMNVKPGFHLYGPGESTGRPIRFELAEGPWKAGQPVYPKTETKQTSLGPSVIIQGKARAKLPVSAESDDPGPVKGFFHYQVCTEKACDRPRKLPFALEA